MARHFVDETAEFKMPRPGRHAVADTDEMEMTQRFDPGFSRRPTVPAVPPREDETR